MSSYETSAFQDEINKIDQRHVKLEESEEALENFITSKNFSVVSEKNEIKFYRSMQRFGNNIITLIEAIQSLGVQTLGVPPYEAKAVPEEEKKIEEEEKRELALSSPKALVVAVALAACGALVVQGNLPPIIFTVAIFVSIGLMFMPQIQSVIEGLLRREEEKVEETKSMRLEDWISDSLAKMRDLYKGASQLTMFQSQTKESLPNYGLPGVNEAIYNRQKYFEKTLRPDFLSRINKIMVACDKNEWARRAMIANFISVTKQATAKAT